MPISDAIQELNTEHEIFFLLTAYIEALGFCDKLSLLPWQMRTLPLAGFSDVEARIDGLRLQLREMASEADLRARVVIEETIEVFSTASRRLLILQGDGDLPRAA